MTINEIQNLGIIGAGGAGFPTHVKLNSNPDTIIMGTGNGMNIATVFTMTPTTTYTRNGSPTTLDGIKYLDTGYISYRAVYPSGSLLACAVVMLNRDSKFASLGLRGPRRTCASLSHPT